MLCSGGALAAALVEQVFPNPVPSAVPAEGAAGAFARPRREGAGEPGEARAAEPPRGARERPAGAGERSGAAERWRLVLARLDRQRADAYAAGEPRMLRQVYAAGSAVLRRDQHVLGRYRDRGLRVHGLRMHVAGLRVRVQRSRRVVLLVEERLAGATVLGAGRRIRLAGDDAQRHLVTLRATAGGQEWRISAARRATS